jgi:hypothetical protein
MVALHLPRRTTTTAAAGPTFAFQARAPGIFSPRKHRRQASQGIRPLIGRRRQRRC